MREFDPQTRQRRQQLAAHIQQELGLDPLFAPHADVVFQNQELLGEGGMSKVYRVFDGRTGRYGALKVLKPEFHKREDIQRFLREAKITASLDHPSIPPVYEIGTMVDGSLFILMKIIEGETLLEKIKWAHRGDEPLKSDITRLLQAFLKVCEAMAFAHDQGIVHRDLKPENIMIGSFGEVMVLDWGLAKELDPTGDPESSEFGKTRGGDTKVTDTARRARVSSSNRGVDLTMAGDILGTPGYMAPEQIRGQATEYADLFSLGLILTEILTGEVAIPGDSTQQRISATLEGRILSPEELCGGISSELNHLAVYACAPLIEHRIRGSSFFAAELRAYLQGETLQSYRYSFGEQVSRWVREHNTAFALACSALVLASMAGFFWQFVRQKQRDTLLAKLKAAAARRQAKELKSSTQKALSERDQARAREQQSFELLRLLTRIEGAIVRGADEAFLEPLFDKASGWVDQQPELVMTLAQLAEKAQLWDRAERGYKSLLDDEFKVFEVLTRLEFLSVRRKKVFQINQTPYFDELEKRAQAEGYNGPYLKFTKALRCQQSNQFGAALKIYNNIEGQVQLASFYLLRAEAHFRRQSHDEAFDDIAKALEIDPRGEHIFYMRAQLYYALGDFTNALRDINQSLSLHKDGRSYAARGQLYVGLKKNKQAIRDFDRALKLNPDLITTYFSRAATYLNMGDQASAELDLQTVQRLDWQSAENHTLMGEIDARLKRYDSAMKNFDAALKLNPRYSLAYYDRARVLTLRGQMREALNDYSRAIQYNPSFTNALFARGQILAQSRQLDLALRDFNQILKIDPTNAKTLVIRGLCYSHKGDPESALKDYAQAERIAPNIADIYTNRGFLYCGIKKYSLALQEFQKAVVLEPNKYKHFLNRGIANTALNNTEKAALDFEESLKLKPDHEQANHCRKFIRKHLKRDPRY